MREMSVKDKVKGSEGKELDEVCVECGKEVVKEAVECERWFHIKCVRVAVGTYKVLMGAEKSTCERTRVRTGKGG